MSCLVFHKATTSIHVYYRSTFIIRNWQKFCELAFRRSVGQLGHYWLLIQCFKQCSELFTVAHRISKNTRQNFQFSCRILFNQVWCCIAKSVNFSFNNKLLSIVLEQWTGPVVLDTVSIYFFLHFKLLSGHIAHDYQLIVSSVRTVVSIYSVNF